MKKSPFNILGAIVASILLVAGVAWALEGSANLESETQVEADDDLSLFGSGLLGLEVDVDDDDNSSDSSTSTSLDDDDEEEPTTTITTIDDGDDDADDTEARVTSDLSTDGTVSYDVEGIAIVELRVVDGRLELVNVSVDPGWDFEIDTASAEEIEIEFSNGSTRIDFEAELGLELRVDIDR